MVKCIYGEKILDCCLRDEDGNLVFIYPETFYPKGEIGYWQLKQWLNGWKVINFLRAEKGK